MVFTSNGKFVSILEQLEAIAQLKPGATAIDDGGGQVLHYEHLVGRARGIGAWLSQRGVGAEARVGVCLPRGASLVIAELGVWMAGAAFVPLDPESPSERLRAVAQDAALRIVLTDEAVIERLPKELQRQRVDQIEPNASYRSAQIEPGQLAYVMYTSGSTGQPKGVMVEHASLANFVRWHRDTFEITPRSRTTMVYSSAFDSSQAEIWPALTAGAHILVPDEETRLVAERLQRWMIDREITLTDLPSPLADRLLELAWPEQGTLRTLLSGGDRLHGRPRENSYFQVFNQYGPTEATVTATSGRVQAKDSSEPAGIGNPIAGVSAYVLDPAMQPVPVGAEGELYLGGVGVARGYLGQPEATAAKFLRDPFAPDSSARMYRTGDKVRRLADGSLQFCGRADAQIKLRGYRIEPGEIVAALRTHPRVADAHVMLRSDMLIAYVVPSGGAQLDMTAVREHAAKLLPAYMVPARYMALATLPLTANGKVDARALPVPEQVAVSTKQQPRTAIERDLARLWQRLLNSDEIGIDDGFFELGGNSLLLAQAHYVMTNELGYRLTMVSMFEHPTIRALARHLSAPLETTATSNRRAEQGAGRSRLQGRLARAGGDAEKRR